MACHHECYVMLWHTIPMQPLYPLKYGDILCRTSYLGMEYSGMLTPSEFYF